ncbi:MAG: hypothetical protein ACJAT7_000620 [Psychromonas sp.]|jgi:hypothetical protein
MSPFVMVNSIGASALTYAVGKTELGGKTLAELLN